MKRMLTRALALFLTLMLALPAAMAAEEIVVPDEGKGYQNIAAAAAVGDTVYLLKVNGVHAELRLWKAGMDGSKTVYSELYYAPRYNTYADLEQAIPDEAGAISPDYAISTIFSDGEMLYGINHLTGGVFTIDASGETPFFTDVVTLKNTAPLFNPDDTDWVYDSQAPVGFYNKPKNVIRVGDWMLWCAADRKMSHYNNRILAFNLVTGNVKQAIMPTIAAMSSYKDGKALIAGLGGKMTYTNGKANGVPYTLHTYDPATDELVFLAELNPDSVSGMRTIAYSEALDMVVYQDQTRIMGWSEATGEKQIGFTPTTLSMENALCVGDQLLYATTDNSGITAAKLNKDYAPEKSLNILGGTMNKVVSRFAKTWNGIPFYYSDVPEGMSLADYLHSENAPDLIKFSVQDGEYIRLLDCGYLLDLSSYAEIREYADVLYPPYQELVMRESGVYGVPVYANSYNGWYINKEVMNAMGLTAADIPTDLVGLCDFAVRWNNEWAEKYPHFTLLNNTENYRHRFLEAMMDEWAEYCLYMGKPLNYDDPIFREMLTALDAADFTKIDAALKQTNPEISEYKQALIWTGCKDVGNFATYMEETSDRIFIPLTMTKETPYIAAVENVDVWVVNANSKNAEDAAAMLAAQIDVIDNVHAYVLRSDKTDAVPDAYWQDSIDQEIGRLEDLEKRVEDSVNRETILKQIEEQKQRIENMEQDMRYVINASAIKQYVEVIMPASVVVTGDYTHSANGYLNEMIECIEDFKARQCTVDEFITNMSQAVSQ